MSEIAGAGEHFYKCDTCGKETIHDELINNLPSNWYYIAMGMGNDIELPDTVTRYCSKECRESWTLVRVFKVNDFGNIQFINGVAEFTSTFMNYRMGT